MRRRCHSRDWARGDLAVADADDVCEAVARHVCEEYAEHRVNEYNGRTFFFVKGFRRQFGGVIAAHACRRIPGEDLFFREDDIGHAVAIEVDELYVRVSEVDGRIAIEGHEWQPALVVVRQLEIAEVRRPGAHYEFPAIAGEAGQLKAAAVQPGERGFRGDEARGGKDALAQVVVIIPAFGLLA